MRHITKYKTFDSSEEMEKWQEENNVTVFSVIPIPQDVKASGEEKNGQQKVFHAKINITMRVFVTYADVNKELMAFAKEEFQTNEAAIRLADFISSLGENITPNYKEVVKDANKIMENFRRIRTEKSKFREKI